MNNKDIMVVQVSHWPTNYPERVRRFNMEVPVNPSVEEYNRPEIIRLWVDAYAKTSIYPTLRNHVTVQWKLIKTQTSTGKEIFHGLVVYQ